MEKKLFMNGMCKTLTILSGYSRQNAKSKYERRSGAGGEGQACCELNLVLLTQGAHALPVLMTSLSC